MITFNRFIFLTKWISEREGSVPLPALPSMAHHVRKVGLLQTEQVCSHCYVLW